MQSAGNSEGGRRTRKREAEEGFEAPRFFIFSLIAATATTVAVTRLRRTFDWFFSQVYSSSSAWRSSNGGTSSTNGGFREEAWRRYNRRMQEEYEEEMERVERIKRMQSVFNRERNKHKNTYESWREHGPGAYQYYRHAERDDWYWKSDTSYRNQRANSRSTPTEVGSRSMSHHYSILGLHRSRTKPYSDAEIKTAFRAKAMEYHPDQNQSNKEAAEAKFKEVMSSYEAIKAERGNGKH